MVKTNIDWYGLHFSEDNIVEWVNYAKQKVDAFIKMMRRVYDAVKSIVERVGNAIYDILHKYCQEFSTNDSQTNTRLFYCHCKSRNQKVNTNPYWLNHRMYHIRDRC